MADTKISALTAASSAVGSQEYAVNEALVSKKVTGDQLKTFVTPPTLFKVLTSDASGTNVNTAQPWFPTNSGVTVDGSTTYLFEGLIHTTRAAGTTSHTTGIGFGGSATINLMLWHAVTKTGDTAASAAANAIVATAATNTTVKAASTSATENFVSRVHGMVRINGTGTFIPQFTYSAAPGGAPTIKANSYFALWRMGDSVVSEIGTWA